jgi:hypothetical protein
VEVRAVALDADGYPTEETLKRLAGFEITQSAEALDYLAGTWNQFYGSLRVELMDSEKADVNAEDDERYLRLATGGWSGNEELLSAFRGSLGWHLTWVLSARGGLYIFRYPPRG